MRILVALDENTYSDDAVKQAAVLAANTWADVTLLTIAPPTNEGSGNPGSDVSAGLKRSRTLFLEACPGDASPYEETTIGEEIVEIKKGTYEVLQVHRPAKKDLKLRIRTGEPAEEILAEAGDNGHDLIVLGSPQGDVSAWKASKKVPAKVVDESLCSVLVVKENRPIRTILSCLDQSGVSQESMEIVNQMAVIHKAKLTLIGLTREQAIKVDVDRELWRIQDYYRSHGIDSEVWLREISSLENFPGSEEMPDLLAVWMNKKSLIKKFLSEGWAGKLVSTSPCSSLILR